MKRALVVLALLPAAAALAQPSPPPPRPTQSPEPTQSPQKEEPPPPPAAPPPAPETDEAAAEAPPEQRFARFGAGVSGGALPAYYGIAWGVGAEAGVALNFGQLFSLRLLANYTHTENGPYATNLVLGVVEPTIWFGVYGLGAAAIFGAGDISRDGFGGALGAFGSPVKLRFGSSITHELSLDLGAILISSDPNGVSAFGRLAYNVYF
jgi:hypothetical protein